MYEVQTQAKPNPQRQESEQGLLSEGEGSRLERGGRAMDLGGGKALHLDGSSGYRVYTFGETHQILKFCAFYYVKLLLKKERGKEGGREEGSLREGGREEKVSDRIIRGEESEK